MNDLLFKAIVATTLIFACQSFGQPGPNLAIGQKIVPFDPKYISPANDITKTTILNHLNAKIDQALSDGVISIGTVELRKFKEQLKDIHFYVVAGGASAVGLGQFSVRLGSVYTSENKSIYINMDTFMDEPEKSLYLILHEAFGALGYNDVNYQLSCVLESRQRKSISDTIQKLNLNLAKKMTGSPHNQVKNYNSKVLAGGTTVIGGGGDELLLRAKVFMLDQFEFWKIHILPVFLKTDDFLKIQAKISFEIKSKINEQFLNEYLVYFIQAPFEPLTIQTGPIPGQLSHPEDVDQIFGIFQNEFSPLFVRLSRDHWSWQMGSLNLEQSRLVIMSAIHTQFFFAYLNMRHEK